MQPNAPCNNEENDDPYHPTFDDNTVMCMAAVKDGKLTKKHFLQFKGLYIYVHTLESHLDYKVRLLRDTGSDENWLGHRTIQEIYNLAQQHNIPIKIRRTNRQFLTGNGYIKPKRVLEIPMHLIYDCIQKK